MSRVFLAPLLVLIIGGCSSSDNVRLQDVNPNRTYDAGYDQVLQEVRSYLAREGYNLDRFETDYGTIVAHKAEDGASGDGGPNAPTQVVVIKLAVEREAARRTSVHATFSFGGVHSGQTRDDEALLARQYTRLFEYLDSSLRRRN